jgi:hypothetical protein
MSSTDNHSNDQAMKNIDGIIMSLKRQIKQLRLLKKRYRKDVYIAAKIKKKRDIKTGFAKSSLVPDKIADFLNIPKGTSMSRPVVTKYIYRELKNRGLYYENDKRVLRVDDDVCEMFNLPKNVNHITDPKDPNGFNLFNFQKKVASCYQYDDED